MSFSQPAWLILLLALPLGVILLRPRTARHWGQAGLRALIWSALVLALAGAQVVQRLDRLAVVFLVDVSDSVPPAGRQAQLDFIAQALAGRAADDLWAVLAYGGQTQLVRALGEGGQPPASLDASAARPDQTDIAQAIQAGLALLPLGGARRLVLMGDGQATRGETRAAAERARAQGVEISVFPVAQDTRPDVRLLALSAPPQVGEGQRYDVEALISADAPTAAVLQLFANGALAAEESVVLRAGENRFSLGQVAQDSGFQGLEARILPQSADRTTRNNVLSAVTRVSGPERVWVVSQQDDAQAQALAAALKAAGLQAEQRRPDELPASSAALADAASVVLVNLPASAFSARQLLALRAYVGELGGGLVLIGGDRAFALGGYERTPLEELSPVDMRLKDRQRLPRLAVAFVLDRSGSMSALDVDGRFTNLQLAQQAVLLSAELLQPDDRVAVIGFDQQAQFVAPFQPADDMLILQERVASMQPGGGTSLLAGINLAAPALLAEQEVEARHLILLSDGISQDRQLVERVAELNRAGITLSVIGLGVGQPQVLEQMAAAGQGQYHAVADSRQLPRIFVQEMAFASRAYSVERDFIPLRASHPILEGLSALPLLRGYVASTPKESASVLLGSGQPYDDPILAVWPYGLGRVAAFTSDAGARWAAAWAAWDQAAVWWGQLIGWTIMRRADDLQAQVSLQADGRARLIVDALDAEGAFRDDLALSANLSAPDGTSRTLVLEQTASGRYEATFTPDVEGAYFLAVSDAQGESRALTGWTLGYSAEYGPLRPENDALLADVARQTGGLDLSTEPRASFDRNLPAQESRAPLAPVLLLLALLLWPLDVALRRLVLSREDWRALWAKLRPARPSAPLFLTQLQVAKDRARQRTTDDAPSSLRLPSAPSAPITPAEQTVKGTRQAIAEMVRKRRQRQDGQDGTDA
ncbi:MAG: VWA domain-containing protein [Anaerolineae bacterium]|nr:VWA domain-containing protein [Anaerolineae bacterium]MDW8171229.1 VWA domain-containing protein [Anaerolineae bacterium]